MEAIVIEQQIKNWAKDNIDENFEFRENQLEIIEKIVENIVNEGQGHSYHNHIIEAPTGAGKSLILIISAGVLADYYHVPSYILCSDLYLWKQYDSFIDKHPKLNEKIGRIKGQQGNYQCLRNKKDIKNAECKMAKMSWQKLFNPIKAKSLGYDCATFCPYVKARRKAMLSRITLMTYQLYIRSFGRSDDNSTYISDTPVVDMYSERLEPDYEKCISWEVRPVIFCDECHNIPGIVQGSFAPVIKEADFANLDTLWRYATSLEQSLFEDEYQKILTHCANNIAESDRSLKTQLYSHFNIISSDNVSKQDTFDAIKKLVDFIRKFELLCEEIHNKFADKVQRKDYINKEEYEVYEKTNWFNQYLKFFNNFIPTIENVGVEYMVKTVTREPNEKTGKKQTVISFGCAKEDFLVAQKILRTAKFRVMTSATIGGKECFDETMGIYLSDDGTSTLDVLPSTFDFDKSPIYYLGRWKMSRDQKDASFPYIQKAIYELCTRFKDYKGVIQTWSYENAKIIFENAPDEIQKRLILYDDAKAKQEMIEYHKNTGLKTILIGPSLNEGIDLPGDECRFIIMMKMPFPYLGDNLIKAKTEIFPHWYSSETARTVIQAIGRGNRFKEDWCITYILDGCFGNLYNQTKDQFSMELRKRIKFYN